MAKKIIFYLLLIFLSVGSVSLSYSQNTDKIVTKSFPVKNDQTVKLDLKFGDLIKVTGWDKDKIQFKAVININNGRLSDALILDFDRTNEAFKISSDYNEQLIRKGRYDDCPEEYSTYSWNKNGDHIVICSDIKYRIYIPKNADLQIESISADIVLTELRGAIDVKTISGFIDWTRLPKTGAVLSIDTITGQAYTSFDEFEIKDKESTSWSLSLKGVLNGGGPSVKLETISGNIYLRKNSNKK